MSDNSNNDYTVRGWLRDLRENGMANHVAEERRCEAAESRWKWSFFLGVGFAGLGLLKILTYKDGLLEWWRITCMTYEEVSQTPYLAIWTSGRGVVGIMWVVVGLVSARQGLAQRKARKDLADRADTGQNRIGVEPPPEQK